MIEEKILNFVMEALISSCRQLDETSMNFFIGSRRLYIGSHISKYCNLIKQKQSNKKIDMSQHSLLFEDLAEIGAGLRTRCIFICTLSLGLKLITAGLLNYESSSDDSTCCEQLIKPKEEVIDLDDLPEDYPPITHKPSIAINATKWLNVLEYALEQIKKEDFVQTCFETIPKSQTEFSQPEITLVKGMIKSVELFIKEWRATCTTCTQIEALTKAVNVVEMNVKDEMIIKSLKRNGPNRDRLFSRNNPGIQVLATGLRAMLEAIKDY